ncbi:MAG TPA: hypothetical protein VI277_03755, partial [Candidatus Limnocylindria bacterium]
MTPRAGRVLLLGAGMTFALVGAWLVPPLAILVAWPLFLFVPGWTVVSGVGSRLDTAGRLGLAVVLSIVGSTHLVNLMSHLAGGYGRAVVFAAAALLAAVPLAAVWRGWSPSVPRIGRHLRGIAVVALLAMLVVGITLGVGLWRTTATGISSGGTNWSDLGVHLSIAETLNAGANFPPEVPYFAGEPLVYHWFADFGAAILAEAADLF